MRLLRLLQSLAMTAGIATPPLTINPQPYNPFLFTKVDVVAHRLDFNKIFRVILVTFQPFHSLIHNNYRKGYFSFRFPHALGNLVITTNITDHD